jgi:Ca2+-binding RTX toxin-like protein
MNLRQSFALLLHSRPTTSKHPSRTTRPLTFEELSARKLLAADVTFASGVLTITDNADEANDIHVKSYHGTLYNALRVFDGTVDKSPKDGSGNFYSPSAVNQINIFVHGGADKVRVEATEFWAGEYHDRFTGLSGYVINAGGESENDKDTVEVVDRDRNFHTVSIIGGGGDDDLFGGAAGDTIVGQGGQDLIRGYLGADKLYGHFQQSDEASDSIGAGEVDQIEGDDKDSPDADGGGMDTIYGHGGNDILYGHGGKDSIVGGDGNDWIDGGKYNDHLLGGNHDDTILGGLGSDTISGGDGADSILAGDNDDQVAGDPANIANADTIYGGDGNDTLHGGDGNDSIFGEVGNDYIYGGNGSDKLYGGNDDDRIEGGHFDDAPDTIDGGSHGISGDSAFGYEYDDVDVLSGIEHY